MIAVSGKNLVSHNSAADWAEELYKHYKYSESLVVWNKEKKTFGIFGPRRQDWWRHPWIQWTNFVAQIVLETK